MHVRTKLTPHCFYQEPLPPPLTTPWNQWLIKTVPWTLNHPVWSCLLIWFHWRLEGTLKHSETGRELLGFYGNLGLLLIPPFPKHSRSAQKRRDRALRSVFLGIGSVSFCVHTPALTRAKYKKSGSQTVTTWHWTVTKAKSSRDSSLLLQISEPPRFPL